MRRQVVTGMAIGVGVFVAIGVVVLIAQQGLIGGKEQRLLARAAQAQRDGKLSDAQANLEELIAAYPNSAWTDDALLQIGEVYEAQQQLVEARAMYKTLLEKFSGSSLVPAAQVKLGSVNVALLFSPTVTDLDAVHEVQPGDTLGRIASESHTTVELLKKANHLRSDVIRPNQKLKVPKGRFGIVVDKSQNQLLLTEDNQFIKTYPVATGTNNSTPVGTFKVVTKVPNPVWYKQGAVVPAESPENILGTRWLGISKEGYGIHGSTDPNAIGHQVTAGCVRMTNSDVEELFDLVPLGTEVTIVD